MAIRIARRTLRTDRGSARSLFGGHDLSAEQHRAESSGLRHRVIGPWPSATGYVRWHARLEETGVLHPVPGAPRPNWPATPLPRFLDLSGEFHSAAETFNGVTYGAQPGTEAGYRQIAELDRPLTRLVAP